MFQWSACFPENLEWTHATENIYSIKQRIRLANGFFVKKILAFEVSFYTLLRFKSVRIYTKETNGNIDSAMFTRYLYNLIWSRWFVIYLVTQRTRGKIFLFFFICRHIWNKETNRLAKYYLADKPVKISMNQWNVIMLNPVFPTLVWKEFIHSF